MKKIIIVLIIFVLLIFVAYAYSIFRTKETCIKEGMKGKLSNKDICCNGLIQISDSTVKGVGGCETPDSKVFVCSNCGNDNCEQWENECNCYKDCESGLSKYVEWMKECEEKSGAFISEDPCFSEDAELQEPWDWQKDEKKSYCCLKIAA